MPTYGAKVFNVSVAACTPMNALPDATQSTKPCLSGSGKSSPVVLANNTAS
jgi:hypothetical protein